MSCRGCLEESAHSFIQSSMLRKPQLSTRWALSAEGGERAGSGHWTAAAAKQPGTPVPVAALSPAHRPCTPAAFPRRFLPFEARNPRMDRTSFSRTRPCAFARSYALACVIDALWHRRRLLMNEHLEVPHGVGTTVRRLCGTIACTC